MTTKLFFMAALALTFAACSNDDNDFENPAQQPAEAQGIPFTATISMGGDKATTRALSENGSGLTATWTVDEEVALIHNGIIDKVTVASVDGNVATISGTITSDADGAAVTVIFPYSAVDLDTKDVKADLLYAQSGGTLDDVAAKYDVRKGTGTLKVSGTASLNDDVTLNNQFAIFKFTTKNSDGSATIDVKPLTITIGAQDYVIDPASATSELFVALPPISSQEVTFTATGSDSKTYTASKASVTFSAGKYYQSNIKLTEQAPALNLTSPIVGQVIGDDGKNYDYASLPGGVTAVAKICYASGEHGLALALADESSDAMDWSTAMSTCAAHTPAFTGGTWKLATEEEWRNMITAAGSHTALRDGFSSVGGSNLQAELYWSSTEVANTTPPRARACDFSDGSWLTRQETASHLVRSCLAF